MGFLSGILGAASSFFGGQAVEHAGSQQAAMGKEIMGYAKPFIQGGQQAMTQANSFLGLGDNPFDQSNLQSHQLMGVSALQSNVNPFEASNFIDGLEPGQQAFDYDRTIGEYDQSNAKAGNDLILDHAMNSYMNSVFGHQLSGKAMSGAMQTAARTNAESRNQWAVRQMASDQTSLNAGRQGIQSDINSRQRQFMNFVGQQNAGINAISGAASGARIAAQGYGTQARGKQQQISGITNGIGSIVTAAAQFMGGGA